MLPPRTRSVRLVTLVDDEAVEVDVLELRSPHQSADGAQHDVQIGQLVVQLVLVSAVVHADAQPRRKLVKLVFPVL